MLYEYEGKVYVRPYDNKIVEVTIYKDINGDYDVKATENIIVDDNISSKLKSISTESAYELLNSKKKKKID